MSDQPEIHRLTDGSILTDPQPRAPMNLARRDWVRVDGRPWQIIDLRTARGGARLVLLQRGIRRGSVRVAAGQTLEVYLQIQPPTGPPPRRARR
jgi:hypothetical protein